MTLIEWAKDIFRNGPELWYDEKTVTNEKGVSMKRDTSRLRECSLGLVSANTPEEWYRIVRLNCPAGTVIEEYAEDSWKQLYDDMLSLVRNQLTKALLTERNGKSAKVLMDILSKRDAEHWADKQKSIEMKHGDTEIKFKFEKL